MNEPTVDPELQNLTPILDVEGVQNKMDYSKLSADDIQHMIKKLNDENAAHRNLNKELSTKLSIIETAQKNAELEAEQKRIKRLEEDKKFESLYETTKKTKEQIEKELNEKSELLKFLEESAKKEYDELVLKLPENLQASFTTLGYKYKNLLVNILGNITKTEGIASFGSEGAKSNIHKPDVKSMTYAEFNAALLKDASLIEKI